MSFVERRLRTDAAGRLSVPGVVPGMSYLVRDGRWDLSDEAWLRSVQAMETLVDEGGRGDPAAPRTVVLDTRVLLRVSDAGGRPVPLKRITAMSFARGAGRPAQLPEVPRVSERLPDGSLLLDGGPFRGYGTARRKNVPAPVTVVEVEAETDDGRLIKAAGAYDDPLRLRLIVTDAPLGQD
jgi:hypothetical protein